MCIIVVLYKAGFLKSDEQWHIERNGVFFFSFRFLPRHFEEVSSFFDVVLFNFIYFLFSALSCFTNSGNF